MNQIQIEKPHFLKPWSGRWRINKTWACGGRVKTHTYNKTSDYLYLGCLVTNYYRQLWEQRLYHNTGIKSCHVFKKGTNNEKNWLRRKIESLVRRYNKTDETQYLQRARDLAQSDSENQRAPTEMEMLFQKWNEVTENNKEKS